jgi:hypothetical protein
MLVREEPTMNMIFTDDDITDVLDKVRRFATARDRHTDGEVRTFTLTDDEGLAILMHITLLEAIA